MWSTPSPNGSDSGFSSSGEYVAVGAKTEAYSPALCLDSDVSSSSISRKRKASYTLSPEEKSKKRRQCNRACSQRIRDRNKQHTQLLEEKVKSCEQENEDLHRRLSNLDAENAAVRCKIDEIKAFLEAARAGNEYDALQNVDAVEPSDASSVVTRGMATLVTDTMSMPCVFADGESVSSGSAVPGIPLQWERLSTARNSLASAVVISLLAFMLVANVPSTLITAAITRARANFSALAEASTPSSETTLSARTVEGSFRTTGWEMHASKGKKPRRLLSQVTFSSWISSLKPIEVS